MHKIKIVYDVSFLFYYDESNMDIYKQNFIGMDAYIKYVSNLFMIFQ